MSAAAIGATNPAGPAMLGGMKRPSTPSMFRQETKRIVRRKAKGGPRASIGNVALAPTSNARPGKQLVGFATNIAGPLKWARTILRQAGLPTDLRPRVRKDGTKNIALLDDEIVEKGTLVWRAARVVFHATSALSNVQAGNADGAAYNANLATEHFWRGWFDETIAPFLRTGLRVLRGVKKHADDTRRQSGTDRLVARYLQLLAENLGRDKAPFIRQVAREFHISPAAAKKRIQRYPKGQ